MSPSASPDDSQIVRALRGLVEAMQRHDPQSIPGRVLSTTMPAGLDESALAWLVGRERATPPIHKFMLSGKTCTVDGAPIPVTGKGLQLAWLVLALNQYRLGTIRAEWVFPSSNSSRCAVQALSRAALAVEPYCAHLASAIHGIGTRRGVLCYLPTATPGIRCTLPAGVTSA